MRISTDFVFRVGMIIKGVDSLLEILGGVLLAQPTKVARYISILAEHEVYRHHQALSGKLDKLADNVTTHASMGEAAYLFIHGLAKLILIAAALQNRRWGYLGLMAVLSFFSVVEFIRAVTAHEVVTFGLGLFDVAVVILIAKEYKTRYGKAAAPEISA